MDTRFAITEYPDAAAITAQLDALIKKPIYSINRAALKRYEEEYFEKKCAKSKEMITEAKNVIPGGVHHNLAFNYPFPIVMTKAKGNRLYDIDGNEYFDFLQAGGPTIIGSNDDVVKEKVKELLDECGPSTGLFHPYEYKLAKKISECFPSVEMFRMLGSGTESCMCAVRVARLATGHKNIIKMGGAYHGWSDQLAWGMRVPGTLNLQSHGVPLFVFKHTQEFFPNDLKDLEKKLIINKFRGDASLFEEGRSLLKELTGIPVVGVIPWFRDIKIEEEDSVALDMKNNTYKDGKINVAIILLKRMSNFTDFDVLEMDPRFNPYYTNNIDEIEKADIILLPGSKNTLSDLQSLRANGIAMAIIRAHKAGKKVIGICGGYQMMGVRLEDPESIEGNIPAIPGLGLLPQCTVIEQEKITRQSDFAFLPSSENKDCKGYEIHMGRTTLLGDAPEQPVARLEDGRTDGYYLNNRCWGSYMHGILDNPAVLDNLAEGFDTETTTGPFDYAAFKEEQYDKLAALVREHVDMEYIYNSIKN